MSDVEQVTEEEFDIDDQQCGNNRRISSRKIFKKSNNNELITNSKNTIINSDNCITNAGDVDSVNNIRINKKRYYCFNLIIKIAFSTPGLVILVCVYSIMGAFIFPLLEAPREISNIAAIVKSREDCLKELWTITEKLNVLYERNWTMLVHEQLRRFEGSIVAATRNGLNSIDLDHSTRWSFSEALLYSITVITTIGHGNLTPKTSGGKIVTILYALIGVPLMLMCLSNLGGLLANLLQCIYTKVCCSKNYKRKTNDNEMKNQHHHHHDRNSCEGQSYEMDCNVCKYDAVNNETKLHGYDYAGINEPEESCQLIHNSPSKFNHHTSSPCVQIKTTTYPILKQYTNVKSLPSSVETSPIKHHMHQHHHQHHQHHHHQQQQYQQHESNHHNPPPQYYPMTTLNYRNNININNFRTSIPLSSPKSSSTTSSVVVTAIDNSSSHNSQTNNGGQQLSTSNLNSTASVGAGAGTTTTTATVYFPITSSTGNSFSCTSGIHCGNQPIVKYHTISLHPHHHQQQQHQTMNSPNKIIATANHPLHTATVHGIRRGKYLPKPKPQEINMLLAENVNTTGCTGTNSNISNIGNNDVILTTLASSSSSSTPSSYRQRDAVDFHSTNNVINENLQVVDIMEDEEENEQNRTGCPHGTPSRIPLISSTLSTTTSATKKNLNLMENEYDTNKELFDLNDIKHCVSNTISNDDDDNNQPNTTETTTTTSTTTKTVQVPITIVLLILITYICFGTIIFAFWENWSFIDGAYFCFVTLSTIGYGDFIPHKTFNNGPNYQLFLCCAYLLLGLVLVAMSFSVLETQLMWKCRKIAVRLKLAKE